MNSTLCQFCSSKALMDKKFVLRKIIALISTDLICFTYWKVFWVSPVLSERKDIGIKDIECKYKGVLLITKMCKVFLLFSLLLVLLFFLSSRSSSIFFKLLFSFFVIHLWHFPLTAYHNQEKQTGIEEDRQGSQNQSQGLRGFQHEA